VIIDHIGFAVSEYGQSKTFYTLALSPLGITIVMEAAGDSADAHARACGFGRDGKPSFWIANKGKTAPYLHVAFTARTRAEVDAFHKAALSAGGVDNGAPGIRADYHPNYYGAFILDPDGHNIEAVCHAPG
jgi:catechol 2,3-dioxygenase-like lactoylglutathione lyase family enzyme